MLLLHEAVGIPYSYCVELRDKGRFGFALPPNQIKATGEETFNGVAALAKELDRTLKRNLKNQALTNSNLKLDNPYATSKLGTQDSR